MARIEYVSESGQLEEARGSDNRLNVSSRADNRAYYNSRDEEQCYTIVYDHVNASAGEYSFYLTNTSDSLTMVISSVGVNSTTQSRFKLWFVTGAAGDGSSVTPVNLNKHSSKAAQATALESAAGTAISNLSTDGQIDDVHVVAGGHSEIRLSDRVRLGQNDAIALEFDNATNTEEASGVVFFYFEED